VTFRRHQDRSDPPLITLQKLTIQGSFLGLLTKHLSAIRADGAHLVIPPFATGEARLLNISRLKAVVGELVANGAVLEFTPRDPGKSRLKFEVHEFVLQIWAAMERCRSKRRCPTRNHREKYARLAAWVRGELMTRRRHKSLALTRSGRQTLACIEALGEFSLQTESSRECSNT
jgi:hypothetical protein